MKKNTIFCALALLVLGGCQTVQDMQSYRRAPQPVVTQVENRLEVAFAYGSSVLKGADMDRLDTFVMKNEITREDDIVLDVAAFGGGLAEERAQAIADYLNQLGLKTQWRSVDGDEGLQNIAVNLVRYQVSVPDCPNWTDNPGTTYHNQISSNFGCAQASNLALMIGNPRDLIKGRDSSLADGERLARSVYTYRNPQTVQAGGTQ